MVEKYTGRAADGLRCTSQLRSVIQSRKKSVWGNHTNVKSQTTGLQRTKTLDSSRSKVMKRNPVKFLSLLTPLIASSVCFLSFLTRPASLVSLRIEGNILFLQDGNLHKGDFYSCFSPASLSVLLPLDGICAPLPHGSPTLHGDYTILLWRGSELVCLAEPHIVLVKKTRTGAHTGRYMEFYNEFHISLRWAPLYGTFS